jgi:FPC/CPF motif-containing protein YcgG
MEATLVTEKYFEFLNAQAFPCIGAKAAVAKDHICCFEADHMACPKDDDAILEFLYRFITYYRKASDRFYSAAVIFKAPEPDSEATFDSLLWLRLRSLQAHDRKTYQHDSRVSSDPESPHFSFSLMQEALYVIGLHPKSNRKARRFEWPTLVFNPHAEFEKLREAGRFETMKKTVQKRDIKFSGSINPLVKDFGEQSEVFQYSGLHHDADWKCPLK